MGAEGVKVYENDFACDVRDEFFERYDAGAGPAALRGEIAREYGAEAVDEADRECLLTALLDCLWSVGEGVEGLREEVRKLLDAGATAAYWGELYPARRKELERLLKKTAKPKASPVKRQKSRAPTRLPFAEGDVLGFEKRNGRVVPVMVWAIETRGPLRYDFVFPNLSRAGDAALVAKFLDGPERLSDEELAVFLGKRLSAPVVTFEHTTLKPHLGRFRKFGSRPFSFPPWRGSSFGYGVTFEDFERRADDGGSRALTPEELRRLGWAG